MKSGRQAGDESTALVLEELNTAGYLANAQLGDEIGPLASRVGPTGLPLVAGWPGAPPDLDSLLTLLADRMEDPELSAEQRGGLKRVRDGLLAAGTNVATPLLTAWLRQEMGGTIF